MNTFGTVHAQVVYEGKPAQLGKQVWIELADSFARPTDEQMETAIASHLEQYQMTLVKIDGWTRASDTGMVGYHRY